jgi:hypothetical protein
MRDHKLQKAANERAAEAQRKVELEKEKARAVA